LCVEFDVHPLEHLVERALTSPIPKSAVNRGPGAISLRHASPGCAGAKHPEHAVKHQSLIGTRAPRATRRIEEVCDQLPVGVGDFVSLLGHGRVPR
jgi:hypothetical protein